MKKSNNRKILSVFSFLLILIFTAMFVDTSLYCQFSGGDGSEKNPYQIRSKQDIGLLADSVNNGVDYWSRNKYFVLMNNITDSVKCMIGFGFGYARQNFFYGVFDGQNHVIVLAMGEDEIKACGNNNVIESVGLFAGVGAGACIKNLVVSGYIGYVKKSGDNIYSALGGIVGELLGEKDNISVLENCINLATVEGHCFFIGGVVGCNVGYAIIKGCFNFGIVRGTYVCGGVCGYSIGDIEYCVNSGFLEPSFNNAGMWFGGIVGENGNGNVVGCINTASISNVFLPVAAGCIVGKNYRGKVIDCHYDKQMCTYGEIGYSEN